MGDCDVLMLIVGEFVWIFVYCGGGKLDLVEYFVDFVFGGFWFYFCGE